ncbi:diaminopimelate epimerase [Glycocaulis albus]|uniref:Diaminopimelate epimerase n=1 Tax=Glycocaulis albus TaxID=1382801 RepID=A0ABQ1XL95_9PROT|nr:diaminopimelate epimerase [Glycocaulis albus]GGG96821.1 diaminopimelate epimerase [Glycocaulis albus]
MKAYAMNGAGNAFIVIDARGDGRTLTLPPGQVAALHACYPFDQIMGLEDHGVADAALRVWNADGGEVGACGNGTRAAAWLMFQDDARSRLNFAAKGGVLSARRLDTGAVEVDLGPPGLGWRDIPLAREMDTLRLDYAASLPGGGRLEGPGAVSMGNPHAVFFVDDVAALPLAEIGPAIEHDPLFPERVNAGFAQVIDRQTIRLRVWERGAGLTLACGTGACAALVAAHRRGLTGREAVIIADGGELPVRWDADGHVHLSGPVEMEGGLDIEGLI